jgi:hypothetical protein
MSTPSPPATERPPLVTMQHVAEQTQLNVKTLSRWVDRGFLPKPVIQTHPSGRGKTGTWPDSVLERCRRIVALRQEGHSPESAVATIELEDRPTEFAPKDQTTIDEILAGGQFELPEGLKLKWLHLFLANVNHLLKKSFIHPDYHRQILGSMREDDLLRRTLRLLQRGYDPILVFDGMATRVEPAFVTAIRTSHADQARRPQCLVPLRPALETFLPLAGLGHLLESEIVTPAPKAWRREGNVLKEYTVHLLGLDGFELVETSGTTVGRRISHLKERDQ